MYIYIHIPFCTNICHYCDFPKIFYHSKYVKPYLQSLKKEIQSTYRNELVTSIYIGGGTPTSLTTEELEELLEITTLFQKQEDLEFTIESNIENLTLEKIQLLKKYRVNRFSLGVQSFQEENLKILNRHHNRNQVIQTIQLLKQEKIKNISIDYIYGIRSNLDDIRDDLEEFLKLEIPHISCYSLIIEENTVFGIHQREYIDEEIEYRMYQMIEEILTKHHYQHYEISNYAKDGYQSRHNLNYWNNASYYGFGLGAVSYQNNYRRMNTKNFSKYLKGQYLEQEIYEAKKIQISNTFILGLRKLEGISIEQFYKTFHQDITSFYNIKQLLQDQILIIEQNYLKINPKYLYLSNEIFIHFV